MKWFETDPRWSLYVNSKEEYLDKFVVNGKFHQKVPKDINDAFETVSFLMAHSYYHWPMYDEALNKALLIMEMAIRIKAKMMDLPLEHKTSKGKIINKKLVDIITGVLGGKNLSFLHEDFDRARNIRNFKVHPDSNFFMGGLGHTQTNIIRLANAINLLFLEQDDIDNLLHIQQDTAHLINQLQKGLYIVELPDMKILADGITSFKYVKHIDGIHFLVINPVQVNMYDSLTNKRYLKPLLLTLKDLKIDSSGFSGIDMKNSLIKMYTTNKTDNLHKYKEYLNDLDKVCEADKAVYKMYTQDWASWETERKIHEYCW